MVVIGYDLDGTLDRFAHGFDRFPLRGDSVHVCISERTWGEWDDLCRKVAQHMPLYIRGTGTIGDIADAAGFKVAMVNLLDIERFYEDHPDQAAHIREHTSCEVILVEP